MIKSKENIVVFEHEIIRFDRGDKKITKDQFDALVHYHGNGIPYYKLVYNGIQFNEHVGVIQVGNILIEVLPKADKNPSSNEEYSKWRNLLIGMLQTVGSFDIKSTSSSNLKIKPNSILDLYFEMYVKEVEYLLHTGLIKKYNKKEGNVTALKGQLQFSKHIQHNLTHKERFYVNHTTYNVDHQLHYIIYKALILLKQINTNKSLIGRIGALLLNFPEMPNIKINEATFDKIIYNRKNQHYQKGIEIAKLLLLQYHPDLSQGNNHVLALMFDMNLLWEQFIYVSLKKNKNDFSKVKPQTSKHFWKPTNGRRTSMKPDIYLETHDARKIVLDTKWKNLNGYNPSPDDLRQMYVYHEFYEAEKVALVYPGDNAKSKKGNYFDRYGIHDETKQCSIVLLDVKNNIKEWQREINTQICEFVSL